jgi:raffinose/stachyose/melibiose transport system substrate-binding protein
MFRSSSRATRRRFLAQTALASAALTAGTRLGAARPALAQGKVELTFWDSLFFGIEDQSTPKSQWFITQALEKFQAANPNITINHVEQSSDIATYDQVLQAANLARNGPDVLTHFAGGGILSYAKFLQPLDQYFTKAEMDQLTGWDSVREDFKADGPIVAVPYGAGSYFEVMYNTDLLGKAGIDPKTQEWPTTWEDLLALGQKIKDAGATPFVIGEQQGYTGAWVMATLVGGQIGTKGFFDMRSGALPINDPSMVNGYANYKLLYDRGLVNGGAGSLTNDEGQQRFLQGEGALFIQGGWFNKQAVAGFGDKVGNFPIPTLKGAPHAGAIAGGPNVSMAITNYSQKKDAAVTFLKFMLRPEIIDLYVAAGQVEPSNHKDANLDVIKNPLLRNQAEWLKKRETIYPFDNIMPQAINDLFYRTNASVFTGRLTPQQGADQLQNEYAKTKAS